MVAVVALLSSCDKGDEQISRDERQIVSYENRNDERSELRSDGWIIVENPTISANYTVKPPKKISDDLYEFVVESFTGKFSETIYVKFYSESTGKVVFQKMNKQSGTSYPTKYHLFKRFPSTGRYYYRHFVQNSSPIILTPLESQGKSILFVRIPQPQNDYERLAKIRNGEDQWNFYKGQCTSWVAAKVNQMWGTETAFHNKMFGDNQRLSNASEWKRRFLDNGYVVDRNPQAGDIIWFPANAERNGRRFAGHKGHVGFVHAVIDNTVYYTDYNGDQRHSLSYCYRFFTFNALPTSTEFIHVQYRRKWLLKSILVFKKSSSFPRGFFSTVGFHRFLGQRFL